MRILFSWFLTPLSGYDKLALFSLPDFEIKILLVGDLPWCTLLLTCKLGEHNTYVGKITLVPPQIAMHINQVKMLIKLVKAMDIQAYVCGVANGNCHRWYVQNDKLHTTGVNLIKMKSITDRHIYFLYQNR